jgi:hypothetical protein
MDQETLTNHISRLGKIYFENACKIVLNDIFNFNAINVDGKGDGGTDYTSFNKNGDRRTVGYQITTQKTDIARKAYNDAKKNIKNLNARKFYYFPTYSLPEADVKILENKIEGDLDIPCTCLTASNIAGLILKENLLNRFLDETNYPLPRDYSSNNFDYREMALHSYTLLSSDATNMKDGIYDDSILFVLSNSVQPLLKDELISRVRSFLSLSTVKDDLLSRRIGALFGKEKLKWVDLNKIVLSDNSKNEVESRKRIYELELTDLASAQTDLLRRDYQIDWTIDDSKQVAIWVAESFITEQISNLRAAKASIVSNPIFFDVDSNGVEKIKNYLHREKSVPSKKTNEIVSKILAFASNHPLITKLTRASVYIALEGASPISSAKALGANRWSDFDILVEPTVAIPYICSQLYSGFVNRYFDMAVRSIEKAKKLDARLFIPYFYINECAGHLLRARKYQNLNLDDNELQFSSNAFVANYYSQKINNQKVPSNFLDYLATFSTSIRTERTPVKDWVRAIMTDIQSLLSKSNVHIVQVPFYEPGDCFVFREAYEEKIDKYRPKPAHLINHDAWALQFTNDCVVNNNEHWILLTYDKALISILETNLYSGWITNPLKFLDMVDTSKSLSDTELVSLVHSVATYSEATLSAGARVIDRIVHFASNEMQNWEFQEEIQKFKRELINSLSPSLNDFMVEDIDKKTDEFLKSHGIDLHDSEEEEVD